MRLCAVFVLWKQVFFPLTSVDSQVKGYIQHFSGVVGVILDWSGATRQVALLIGPDENKVANLF